MVLIHIYYIIRYYTYVHTHTCTHARQHTLCYYFVFLRFDFLRDIPRTSPESPLRCGQSKSYQYVHSSGSILIKINDIILGPDARSPTFNEDDVKESPFRKSRWSSKKAFEPMKDGFGNFGEHSDMHGFFWVYNYALSKKWRTNATGKLMNIQVLMMFFSFISYWCIYLIIYLFMGIVEG